MIFTYRVLYCFCDYVFCGFVRMVCWGWGLLDADFALLCTVGELACVVL